MSIGQIERKTQDRVVEFFQKELKYTYLGNWEERHGNSNIEKEFLKKFLKKKYNDVLIKKDTMYLPFFQLFYNEYKEHFNKNIEQILEFLNQKQQTKKRVIKTDMYHMSCLVDYENLYDTFIHLPVEKK